jgi:RNA polymerase sigma-70 factor (ECF subfamily)
MTDAPENERLSIAEFTALCARAQWPLYAFLRGVVGEDELARDLTQDTFLAMWRMVQRGAPPFDTVHPDAERRRWLFQVAYHRAISALRHRHVLRWHSLDELDDAGHATIGALSFEDDLAESQALRAALTSLAPQDAACLLLIVVQDFTAAETGQILGATPAAVAKRFARAKQRLRAVYLAQNAPTIERSPQ